LDITRDGQVLDPFDLKAMKGPDNNSPCNSDRDIAADQEIIRAAQSGDVDALDALLGRHGRSLYRLCRALLGNAEDAEDAVQETFLRALRSFPKFRRQANVKTWLSRIAVNICIDSKRSKATAATWVESRSRMDYDGPSPDVTAVDGLQMQEALCKLTQRQRTILLLKELEGWSAAEISKSLSCTQRNIYYELSCAHQILAEWRCALDSISGGVQGEGTDK
jgi:RNA polymerase sigma-70 factor (ECF subfamily)